MLLVLAMLLCSSGAFCQTNSTSSADINASALRSLVVDSSAKLESYSFSMEMAQNIDLVNLSSMESQRLYTRSIGLGRANMTDRALKLVMASLTYAKGDEENSSAVALEEYLLNDTIYLKLDGNWTVLKMPGAAAAWSQQSTLEQQVNMFNQSNLTLIGTEIVEGQDCYKVRAKIDMRNSAGQLSGEVASYLPASSANNTDLFNNMTLDVYYWITKDTHLLKKTNVHQVLDLTPQSLGLPAAIGQEVRLDSTTSMLFEGFNESVNVVIPAEAIEAQQFPQGLATSNEAVPVASNESEIEPGESISNTAGLNESKSRLSESIPSTKKINESKSRLSESLSKLNKSMPDEARLNEQKLRLNATMPNAALSSAKISNATLSNATLSNATSSNATSLNATLSNATMQENRTIQAASTPWRIFL